MCFDIQPICNACRVYAKPIERHECIFSNCTYVEERTRFLSCYELPEWDCNTPGCGLNMQTIDDEITELDRMLRMEGIPTQKPAEGDSLGFQGDEGEEAGSGEAAGAESLAITASKATAEPSSPEKIKLQRPKSKKRYSLRELKTGSKRQGFDGGGTSPLGTTESFTNDKSITNGNPDNNIESNFDLDSIDLGSFPRCTNCFIDRRRCNGQSPCDKCKQRKCSKACRPVTLELLKALPTRARRVLETSKKERAKK
ncbi:hypothetical protein diail_12341 [Diaporthe ilicicola]|nr:hypothetical protein diail_12341 [Diaporthe ilicicola]